MEQIASSAAVHVADVLKNNPIAIANADAPRLFMVITSMVRALEEIPIQDRST